MKAWRIERHGGPEVLTLKDVPTPTPGPMEVLVRIEAVGLNHLDLWVQKGVPGHIFPLPLTPGCDISGTLEAFGPGAKEALSADGLLSGTSDTNGVVINPGISCGRCRACLGGFDPLCSRYGILGETQDGGCAQWACVPVQNVIARPKNISAIEAASIPIPFLTAWTMLTRKAELKAGEIVLIQAGGSGVSVAAIQMAKLLGAVVITTVGSDAKARKASALGADHVINYKTTSFRNEVKRIVAGYGRKGCEVVLDHVGADTFQESLRCLAWGGRLITCGATSGSQVNIDLKMVFFKNISILGSTMGSKADLIRIFELLSLGKLKPVIDSTYSLNRLPEAFSKIELREVFGKVVLTAFE